MWLGFLDFLVSGLSLGDLLHGDLWLVAEWAQAGVHVVAESGPSLHSFCLPVCGSLTLVGQSGAVLPSSSSVWLVAVSFLASSAVLISGWLGSGQILLARWAAFLVFGVLA